MKKPKASKPLLRHDEPLRSRPRRRRDPAQPNLLLDPMPSRIEPCLALLKATPPKGDDWLFEVKWDGYRIAVHIELGKVRILTRGGHDWTHRFPTIAAAALKLPVASAIIDGEAVVMDAEGRSDFSLLQKSLGGRSGKAVSSDAVLVAFDLLYFDGHDLTSVELSSRRHMLHDLLGAGVPDILFSETIDADGEQLLAHACELGLEGIIAKHRDSPYRSGRTGDWLKIKCVQSDSFFIVGYEPSSSGLGGVGALLLAAYQGDEIVYAGSVGTGFSEAQAVKLRSTLDRLKRKRPPLVYDGARKNVVWAQPTIIVGIHYRGWTHDGKLRHASFKGVRDVQDNAEVCRVP
ncbi:non-homologous end-joining DNA ligase [Rhizobium rhizogenes]|uniref:DNA ligase (ATP) n=1 Tax=Rhizobium rhizogenes TaxID=359 RepID=A0AA92BZV6_RHIRH|nr:non-homologous end-joining DNA ligase [Rhizobium rhizogenes]PVE50196.1 ATP-dependent DNA ligase [Rhizobium rhizogenes]PVE62543.1 ATP-dependent DNA ligase [Agrobacterium tumefaciens]PVE70681.1 ATP-dependent DNA ligase [Sphingomonas sp. TPD3009]